jgi:hypothetical protein
MKTHADPRAEFERFPRNTRLYAEHWLRTGGTRHPSEHFVIAAKLDAWVAKVGTKLREELLAELVEGAAG